MHQCEGTAAGAQAGERFTMSRRLNPDEEQEAKQNGRQSKRYVAVLKTHLHAGKGPSNVTHEDQVSGIIQ